MGRWFALAERYVRASERIAAAQESSLRIAQGTAESMRKVADARAVLPVDVDEVADAIRDLRNTLAGLMSRFATSPLAGTATEENPAGKVTR